MASIPAEVEVRPQKMAASISSAGEPDQKKNQRKNPKNQVETLSEKKSKQTWARLIKKVFEVDPLICTKCGSEIVVLAIITNPEEVHKILNHLRKNKSPPFDNKSHQKPLNHHFGLLKINPRG